MKISLRWLCDHILDLSWKDVDVPTLVTRFNQKVAEIEHVQTVHYSLEAFEAVRILGFEDGGLQATRANGSACIMPLRSDALSVLDGNAAFLLVHEEATMRWATLRDVGFEKEGLIPALHILDTQLSGGWKDSWEVDDVLLDVDNKSLTHRPDMWGHRGFAREVAALFGKRLIPQNELIEPLRSVASHDCVAVTIASKAVTTCTGFAALCLDDVRPLACNVRAASRLINCGYRPRSALIDMTNYTMADWGHPMHAYDADGVVDNAFTVRYAEPGEHLSLLDDTTIDLSGDDLVVADAERVLALAGIMGGKESGVRSDTHAVLLEAAVFHAATIRRTAARHKLRTESSQRFEKTLDNQRLLSVIERCVFVARQWGVIDEPVLPPVVVSVVMRKPLVLTVSHAVIVSAIGVSIAPAVVMQALQSIEFEVSMTEQNGDVLYTIEVPSYRASKDISGPHDITEEVARLYGFDAITPQLPAVVRRAHDLKAVMRERRMKEYLAHAACMREQRNYAFYKEPVLTTLHWQEPDTVWLQNPVSQEERRLVTCLVPHLLGNVIDNMADVDQCAFFEWNSVWPAGVDAERKELACVWFDKRGRFSFYSLKASITTLCRSEAIELSWQQARTRPQWMAAEQAAELMIGDQCIGFFGMLDPVLVQRMGGLPESGGYACVLNATALLAHVEPTPTVGALRKHQHSTFDVSVLIPQTCRVFELEQQIKNTDCLIEEVRLIDFFEKKEWTDRRSVAFRVTVAHAERSVTKTELESARNAVIQMLIANGAQLRD